MADANQLVTVYDFIKSTGEGNIRKMMAGPKMTPAHIGLLMRLVRSCKAEEFVKYFEAGSFPKIKFSSAEDAIKEGFWGTAWNSFAQLGLVDGKAATTPATPTPKPAKA